MNIRSIYLAGLFAIIGSHIINTNAQQLRNPFDFPILLSGNFGELRSNHFHSGIDFKTQGVEGKPVHTVQEGYVSRISVSPWGYGNGLYITHPDGTTTVYGHLQKFSKKIANYVKEQQYAQESFNVNLFLTPDLLPVEKNEVVALSGNTGSSGGPHLHFEIRDTETEEVMDPLDYFSDRITDTRPPKIQGIQIVPIEGKGVVNGKSKKLEIKPVTAKNGKQTITGKIEAWGEIGLAVKAYDYMDNTTNIYGVREITLTADSQVIFHSNLDKFAFDETRYLNTFTDYEEWKDHRSFYMRSFIEPGNRLRFLESVNRGILRIDEPRTYHLTYTLADAFGNATRLSIWIEGKKQEIPQIDTTHTELFHWGSENRFGAKGIRLVMPHYQPPTYCTISQSLCMERPSYHYSCKAIRLRINNNMVWFAYKTDVPLGWAVHTVMAGSTQISRNWAVIRYNKIQRLRLSRRSTNRRGSANRTSYSVCPIT